jgi:ABC-type uncharacterized transport system permease subunit
MYCQVENQILGSNESYNLIKMCMCCVYMVDGEWTPFGMIFPSLLFGDFETWAIFLYSLLFLCIPLSMYSILSHPFLHSP